jgi:hypothetical protein
MGQFAILMQALREKNAQTPRPVQWDGEEIRSPIKPMGPPITDRAEVDKLLMERFDPYHPSRQKVEVA